MNKTLLSLFEQNEQDFRNELYRISLPRDSKKLQNFMNDFFVNKVSVEEYKKELSMGEIAMLNSVMKVVVLPVSFANEHYVVKPMELKENQRRNTEKSSIKGSPIFDILDVTTLGTTTVGGIVGGLLFRTWGGVLLSIAGCALGMYLTSSSSHINQKQNINIGIDVEKYMQTLKGICKGIDEIILNYHTSIDNITMQYENVPKVTLSTAYKPLLDRMASLFVAVESSPLTPEVKSEFDKLFRTLKNHHYEILGYNNETKEYFIETKSSHVKKATVVKAAILENGNLFENGECLIPEN